MLSVFRFRGVRRCGPEVYRAPKLPSRIKPTAPE
jgi:hypothetical protein